MSSHFFTFSRAPDADTEAGCPHCKSIGRLEALRVDSASLLGRFFIGLSPASPALRCPACGLLSQRISSSTRVVLVASWMPLVLLGGALVALASEDVSVPPEALVALGLGLIALALFLVLRTLASPLYPVAGAAVSSGDRLVWVRRAPKPRRS